MRNQTGTLPAVGPFQTFAAYVARVEREKLQPKRAVRRARPVERGSRPGNRVTRLVLDRMDAFDWAGRN